MDTMNTQQGSILLVSRARVACLGAMRTFGEAGYPVDAIVSCLSEGASNMIAECRFAREVYEAVSPRKADYRDESVLCALLEYAADHFGARTLLFPCDEYCARVIDHYRKELSSCFLMPGMADGSSIEPAFERGALTDMAREAGIPSRRKWVVSLTDYKRVLPRIYYPCECAPVIALPEMGREARVCHTQEKLGNYLALLASRRSNREVAITEMDESGTRYIVYCLCMGGKAVPCGVVMNEPNEEDPLESRALAEVSSAASHPDISQHAQEIASSLGYSGVCGIVFVQVGEELLFTGAVPCMAVSDRALALNGASPLPAFAQFAFTGACEELPSTEPFAERVLNEAVAWNQYAKGIASKAEIQAVAAQATVFLIEDAEDQRVSRLFEKRNAKLSRVILAKKGVKAVKPLVRSAYQVAVGYPQTKKKNRRDSQNGKPRVIVAGRTYSSNLCMARSLGEAGYDVEVLRVFIRRPRRRNRMRAIRPDAYSKYVKAYRICVSGRKRRKVVDALIGMADPERKMLVVPVDDFVASIIDQHYDELSEFFILPNVKGEQGEIGRLMSKSVQKSMAMEAGLPVVGSTVIKSEQGIFRIPDTVKYPCFIKPNISENSYKTRMRRCDTEEELRYILADYAAKQDFEMLVEDYVEIDKEYSLLGLSVKEGVLCPGFFVAEVGGQKEHRGVALLGRVLPVEQQEKLIADISKFVESLDFEGLFDVDLIGSTDGKMYFVELNLRFGGSGYAITRSGLNLPGIYADYKLLGKPVDFSAKVEDAGKVFVNERILLDEYVRGRLTSKEVKDLLARAEIFFMKNLEDLPAYNHFKRFAPVAAVTRQVRLRRERLAQAEETAIAEGLAEGDEPGIS